MATSLSHNFWDILDVETIVAEIVENPEVIKFLTQKVKNIVEHDTDFKLLIDRMAHRYNVSANTAAKSVLSGLPILPKVISDSKKRKL